MFSSINRILLTNAGGTFQIPVIENRDVMLAGTVTLAANVDVQQQGTPTLPTVLRCYCRGAITLGANTVTIFGKTLSTQQALLGCMVETYYDIPGAAWITTVYESTTNYPKVNVGTKLTTLVNGGGTITLVAGKDKKYQTFNGSPTLAASYVITGTGVADGDEFFIKYQGAAVLNGNNITIFGVALTSDQALKGDLMVYAVYDLANAVWKAQLFQSPDVSDAGQYEMITVPISFEAAEQITQNIVVPYAGRIIKNRTVVTKTLAGTDTGDIDITISAVSIGNSPIHIAIGAAAGSQTATTFAAPNEFDANVGFAVAATKTTAGGRATLYLVIQRK